MDTQDTVNSTVNVKQKSWSKSALCLTAMVVWLFTFTGLAATDATGNQLIHNSTTMGSTKWPSGWGIAGGEYGEFDCGTCHDRKTGNIKRIKTTIEAPNGTDEFPIETDLGTVVFNSVTGPGSFGDDTGGHSTSNKICEVCHSRNMYHNYNTANNLTYGGDLTHENQKDCIECHTHSNAFKASCDVCHGNPPITNNTDDSNSTGLVHDPSPTGAISHATSPGAHELHAVTGGMSCTTCHKGNTMPTVSMTIQMGFEATNGNWSQFVGSTTGGNLDAPDDTAGQMSASYEFVSSDGGATTITKVTNNDLNCTVYCHGDWTGSNGSNTAPSWVGGSGEASCGSCHGASPGNAPTRGSHTRHASSGGLSLACTKCHPTVSDQTHLDGSVAWDLATTDPLFGGSATYNGAGSSSTGAVAPSSSYSQCDNIYCHSNVQGQIDPTQNPDYQAPAWGGAIASRCKACHKGGVHPTDFGTDPPMSSGSHSKHVEYQFSNAGAPVISCQACHWLGEALACTPCHTAHAPENYVRLDKHVDGSIDVDFYPAVAGASAAYTGDSAPQTAYGSCNTSYCHSLGDIDVTAGQLPAAYSGDIYSSPDWGGAALGCNGCHGLSTTDGMPDYTSGAAGSETANSHSRHVTGNQVGCEECHFATTEDGASINYSSNKHVNAVNVDVTYNSAGINATATYNPAASEKTCTNNYCHSDGYDGVLTYNSVTWGDAGGATCGTCHGHNEVNWPTSSTHEYHLRPYSEIYNTSKFAGYQYACSTCHDSVVNTTSDATVVPTIKDTSLHVNAERNVVFNSFADAGTPYDNGTKACTNLYCHSQGTKLSSFDAPNRNAVWEGSIAPGTRNCDGCHGNRTAFEFKLTTNAHNAHYNNAGLVGYYVRCSSCHQATMGFGGGSVVRHPENHTNKNINVKWDFDEADFQNSDGYIMKDTDNTTGPAYKGSSAASTTPAGAVFAVGSTPGDCTNVYCHSYGNLDASNDVVDIGGGEFKTIAWNAGSVVDCADCHGNGTVAYPTYANGGAAADDANSHLKHVNDSGYGCQVCHYSTTLSDGNPATSTLIEYGDHLNREETVVFNSAVTSVSANYIPATKTCVEISCHSTGEPVWGGTVNCGDCHAANKSLPASHAVHYNSTTVGDSALATKVTGVTSTYVYQCGSCHDGVTHGSPVEVSLNSNWSGTFSSGECTNVYCHSDGVGNTDNSPVTPSWGGGSLNCGNCHKAQPTTGDHAKHLSDSTYNVRCYECHAVTATNAVDTSVAINNKDTHVDKTKDVDISATFDGNGGTSNWNGTNCTAVYCHSDGKSSLTYDTVAAGSGPANCTFCHGGAGGSNGGAGNALSASHTIHTGTTQFAYTCDVCHVQTASNNTTIGSYANHVNQARDVSVAAANGGTGTIGGDYNGTGCTTTNCHGSDSAGNGESWAAGGTTGDCSFCHGMAASVTDGRDTNGDTATSDAQVGAHVVHLDNATYTITTIACDDCHTDPNATAGSYMDKVNTAGHMNGSAGMSWSTLAQTGGSNPNYDGTKCTNTYCHNPAASTVLRAGNSGTTIEPNWTGGWDNAGKDAVTCGVCHDAPPVTSTYDHSSLSIADACTGCHGHEGRGGTHIDGTLDADATCTGCHSGTGSGSTLVSVNSTHSTNTITGNPTCESCHFDSHGARTTGTVEIPWDTRTMGALSTTQDAADGIIYIKAYTHGTYGTATSEAEACWYCHADNSVSEWNSTADSDPASPGVRPAGSLVTGVSWIGTNWQSANFGYKTGAIESVHETQRDLDTDLNITIHDTTGGAGSHSAVTSGNTNVADISCGVCHDVHSVSTGDTSALAKPYLRGGWTTNPFPEDGAPRSSNPDLSAYVVSFGGVPRGGLGSKHPLSFATNNALGGWQIEQNNSNFSDTSYASFGGLCQKCHSQAALESRWSPHAAVVSGFTGGGSNIFRTSYRSDSSLANYGTWKYAYMRHDNTTGGQNASKPAWLYGLRNDEGTGISPVINPNQPETGANVDLSAMLGVTVDDGSTDPGYHSFPCSKCHSPHASRLPKLMVTNCLDISHNDWDDTIDPSSWAATNNYTATEIGYSPTAVNCHRYVADDDTSAEDKDQSDGKNANTGELGEPGWNSVTPW